MTFIEESPPHSPDLNPIENIFARVKDAVGKELQIYTMQNQDESRKKISAKRDKVGKAMAGKCRGYVESFPDRLKKCIDNGGELFLGRAGKRLLPAGSRRCIDRGQRYGEVV